MPGGVLVSVRLVGLLLLVATGCGRTSLSSSGRTSDAPTAADPLQGVWEADPDFLVPGFIANLQLSFEAGTWQHQIFGDRTSGVPTRQVKMGTYVVDGNAVDMTVTGSSCQGLMEVTTPAVTLVERHGDKLVLDWQDDETSVGAPELSHLRKTVPSDLGQLGCWMSPVRFLPNPIKPVP